MTAPVRAGVAGAARTTLVLTLLLALLSACGGSAATDRTLYLGAIPDQDTDRLAEIYGATAEYLSDELGIDVEFRPVTDYTAAVTQFRTGDLDLVWFGGLTGVQARQQTPGAVPLVQRDIDDDFHTLFIAGRDTVADDIADLAGQTFTFGSNSSTSGYVMPAHHLLQAGVDPETDFRGRPGFSGSHDKTIDLVEAGTYAAGAVNEQVWKARVRAGTVDTTKVRVLWRTPAYADYHWVLGPRALEDFGPDLDDRVRRAFLDLSTQDPHGLLALFGAKAFVPTDAANYRQIEEVGRRLGLVRDR